MSNRKDFFFRQKVTESELDEAFDDLEDADRNTVIDMSAAGVWLGLAVTERGAGQNESVDVAAGSAYDQLGQRMNLPTFQNVDISVDNVSASTQVAGGGNEKLVGVYLKFDRVLSDPRVDGNSVTVFFERDESFQFVVRQGPEEASPATTFPGLQADEILLADVRRVFGDNTIADADIETGRRENSWVQTIGETAGTQAAEVDFLPNLSGWQGGGGINAIAAVDVQAAIDEVVNELGNDAAAGSTGADKVGCKVDGTTWADATTVASLNLNDAVLEVIADLAATQGAGRMGFLANQSQWTDAANALTAGTIQFAIDEIVNDLASQGANPGASLVGANAYVGTNLTFVDGSIEDQLQHVADNVVSEPADNAFTGNNSYTGDSSFAGETHGAADAIGAAGSHIGVGPAAATRYLRRFGRVHSSWSHVRQDWLLGDVIGDFPAWVTGGSTAPGIPNDKLDGAITLGTVLAANDTSTVEGLEANYFRDRGVVTEWAVRTFGGITSMILAFGLSTETGNPSPGTDPLTAGDGLLVRFSTSAADTNWTLVGMNNGAATVAASSTAVASTTDYRLTIVANPDGSAELFVNGVSEATVAAGSVGNTQGNMRPYGYIETLNAAAKALDINKIEVWQAPVI